MTNNLKKIIGFYGISPTQLADESGVARSTIWNAMNGGNVSQATMKKVASAVGNGISVNDIFFAENVQLVVHNKMQELQNN